MDRWVGKVAVVTGASAGIGLDIALHLLKKGMIVVGLARREEKLKEIKAGLASDLREKFHSFKCDVSKEDEVRRAFKWIKDNLKGVDVLINNAGIIRHGHLTNVENTPNMRDVLDTNVMGVVYCTQEAFASMEERNFHGQIVHINGLLGHYFFPGADKNLNVYGASKYALKATIPVIGRNF